VSNTRRVNRLIVCLAVGLFVNVVIAAGLSVSVVTTDGSVGVWMNHGTPGFEDAVAPARDRIIAYATVHLKTAIRDVDVNDTDERRRFGWDALNVGGLLVEEGGSRNRVFVYEERSAGLPFRSTEGRLLLLGSHHPDFADRIISSGIVPLPWSLHAETVGGIIWRPTMGALPNSLLFGLVIWLAIAWKQRLQAAYRRRHGHCPVCGYNLAHTASTACPECGASTRVTRDQVGRR
jgi:hypothetical protein